MDNTKKNNLEDFGYDDYFKSDLEEVEKNNHIVARVVTQYRGAYKVRGEKQDYLAKITGKQMLNASAREDYPAVGDFVVITETGEEQAVIQKILPRKTILRKKFSKKEDSQIIATNIDVAFVVESVDRDYNLNRFERFLVLAKEGGIKPVIILNKIDLITDAELKLKTGELEDRFGDTKIISTSTTSDKGLDELTKYIIKRKTYCLLGSSGVGKSSIINKLIGENLIKTSEIGRHTGRGKHTTTNREMYFLSSGGIVIDNPGTREVGMVDSSAGIENVFAEITELSDRCKYTDCTHTHETDCAVLRAVESDEIDSEKYSNYIKLKKESQHYAMTELERKKKDRQFGKFIKTSKKQFKKNKP